MGLLEPHLHQFKHQNQKAMSKKRPLEKTEHVSFRVSAKEKKLLDTWVHSSRRGKFIRTCLGLEEPFAKPGFVYLTNQDEYVLMIEESDHSRNLIGSNNQYYNIIGDLIGDSEISIDEKDSYLNRGIRLKKQIGRYSEIDENVAIIILNQINNLLELDYFERLVSKEETLLKLQSEISKTKNR
jgi:hypothetical protein